MPCRALASCVYMGVRGGGATKRRKVVVQRPKLTASVWRKQCRQTRCLRRELNKATARMTTPRCFGC